MIKHYLPPQPRTIQTGRRRAFLLVDALAGTALAVIALGMMLWLLSADMKIRRQQLQQQQLLLAVENVLQRLESVPFTELSPARAEAVAGEYQKQAGLGWAELQVKLQEVPGDVTFKRLQVQGRVGASETLKITLWRDRYPMVPGQ